MGFFDIFLSEEKKIAKNRRRLTSRDSQPEDREAAARWLAQNGTPKALMALMSRFDMKLEHQLNDKAEKDVLYALVVSLGDAPVKPLKSWLKQARYVSVPLQLLEELTDEETVVQTVFKLLDAELARDDFKPEKKHTLLTWLGERKHADAIEKAGPFVEDFDENVRCVAVEVLVTQNDQAAAAILEARLANPEEDSNRLRHRVAEIFAARNWPVSNPDGVAANLPEGYSVQGDRVVAR